MTNAKTFLKQLRATLKQHGFQRINANNYFYRALCFNRLEHLFAADFETIRSIDFDEAALIKQFAPQFLARLPAIANTLAAWTDTTSFLQRFGDNFSAQQKAAIAAHTFRPE